MSAPRPIGGVLAPIATPFEAPSGDLDLKHTISNARQLLDQGLDGIVAAGSTGEAPLLDADEQRRLVAALRTVMPRDRWLLAGTGAESTRAAIALSRAAAAEGADALLVRPPSYYGAGHSAQSIAAYFRAVADAAPVPVLVYNIPKYTRLPIAPQLLTELAAHGNIIGAKDSSGDAQNLAAYRAAVPQWSLLVGSGSLLVTALELQCQGGIMAVACFAASLATAVFAAARAADWPRARELQARLAVLDKEIVGKLGPAGIKAAMDCVGLYGGPVRAPLAPLAAPDRDRIGQLLAA
ncbi:MAG TPA: dihydrodipicolinate synthase family protein [Gemmatimonadales bacterium]|nr:dihydrodipicolinate synthase family protein [Gemmatimonadales bacterium]